MTSQDASQFDSREVRLGRILSELQDRCARGEPLCEVQIIEQHPDIADELLGHLATLRNLRRQDQTIEGLIRQALITPSTDPAYRAELGLFRIVEYLGRGGMGIVLKAYEPALRRHVALKLLRPDMTEDAVALARFQREARAAGSLNHPNVLTVFSLGTHAGVHFISMEYVNGPALSDLIRDNGPLATETIRDLMAQLTNGLAAAHSRGLIHRDIKPANLLLEPLRSAPGAKNVSQAYQLKIADFGLARILSSQTKLTQPQQSFGTPQYMSPEQARGDEDIDHRTDLYSAGVVLYEMLAGRVPFTSETPTALVHQVLNADPPDPLSLEQTCDPALASIAMRLISKRTDDRFGSAEELLTALNSGQCVVSYERRRRKNRIASFVIMVITAIAGVAWFNMPSTQPVTAAMGQGNAIRVQYGDSSEWKVLHRYEKSINVVTATVVRPSTTDRPIIIASTQQLPRPDVTFEAFDHRGRPIWTFDLSSDRRWPDCDPTNGWMCNLLLAADLDGRPGDEILAVANDIGQYPARISIIDPMTRVIRATLWHQGNLMASADSLFPNLWLEPDFFGPGRPAIILLTQNNKLDGFYEPDPKDPPKLTSWDIVYAIMILDPRKMLEEVEGLAPPASWRIPIPASIAIHAYTFLDKSTIEDATYSPVSGRVLANPSRDDVVGIERFSRAHEPVTDDSGPWFVIDIKPRFSKWGVIINLDRDLNIRRLRNNPHNPNPMPDSYWLEKWKIVSASAK